MDPTTDDQIDCWGDLNNYNVCTVSSETLCKFKGIKINIIRSICVM